VNIHYLRIFNFWHVIFTTTKNSVGFCKRCNQQVLLMRKEVDKCLAIILLIFTAGIGLLIYLAIYYSKPEDRCIHCGTRIARYPVQSPYYPESQTQYQISQNSTPIRESERSIVPEVHYCPLCGEKIEFGIRFCPDCGGKI